MRPAWKLQSRPCAHSFLEGQWDAARGLIEEAEAAAEEEEQEEAVAAEMAATTTTPINEVAKEERWTMKHGRTANNSPP